MRAAVLAIAFGVLMSQTTANDPPDPVPPPPPMFRAPQPRFEMKLDLTEREYYEDFHLDLSIDDQEDFDVSRSG